MLTMSGGGDIFNTGDGYMKEFEFTAHVRESSNKTQTVREHCFGAADKAECYAHVIGACRIAKLQAITHDIGKLCCDFDAYVKGENDIKRGEIDHCYAGARYLVELARQTGDKRQVETAHFIARTVISHHGLHDWVDENGDTYFDKRISKSERYDEIKENVHLLISDGEILKILETASEEYFKIRASIIGMSGKDKVKGAFYMGQFERLMLSVLVDADRTDTANFQMDRETELHHEQAIWTGFCERMSAQCRAFAERTDYISKLRSDISDRCAAFVNHEVGVCRLIVPTGGGKTISSLRWALNYCKKYGKERIFYIAPYMSILEQNSDVIKDIVGESYFLEHHSDIIASIEEKDELEAYELRTDKWDVPVIATTFVQFLNTFFLGTMASVRRMHRLCNAVIIIDEVQSVPTKCVSLFNLAMNFISKIGCSSVVLCSATQPSLEETKYPIIIDAQESMTGDYSEDFLAFKRNQIVSGVRRSGYTYVEAADYCIERYKEEGSVLFIVNTKTAAFHIYKLLCDANLEDAEVIHISTNMCPEHRRSVIKQLRESLANKQKVICVTTQLIEAGVDISFPCVIRSLAGMDNAAQAAGRCNRSGEFGRPCNVYLINLCEERLGNLREIKTAQDVSGQMLAVGGYEDMLAVDTMTDYFRLYYDARKEELNYNVVDAGVTTDLLNLLSIDRYRWELKNGSRHITCAQAFKTAGKQFHVIDENTTPVIVPYDEEAKRLLMALDTDLYLDEAIKLLRQAQKYVVGIYAHTKNALDEKGALYMLKCGAIAIREEFYDNRLGIVLDGRSMDVMIF